MPITCTEFERKEISKILMNMNENTINDGINILKKNGVQFYNTGDVWEPKSRNSHGEKMKAKAMSVVFSFYIKKQISITKEYAKKFNCPFWKYNIMVDIMKIPDFIAKLKEDYFERKLLAESFDGPGKETTGIFLEICKENIYSRIYIELDSNKL